MILLATKAQIRDDRDLYAGPATLYVPQATLKRPSETTLTYLKLISGFTEHDPLE